MYSNTYLLLCSRGRVDGEGLAARANKPTVPELTVIFERLKFDLKNIK